MFLQDLSFRPGRTGKVPASSCRKAVSDTLSLAGIHTGTAGTSGIILNQPMQHEKRPQSSCLISYRVG